MGLVTEALINQLSEQVKAHGTLVWYDSESAYLKLVQSLSPDDVGGAELFCYENEQGFFQLRYELEEIWSRTQNPPRLIIYVPLARNKTENALIEFEAGGAVLRPGMQPPNQNTALSAVAQAALEKVFPAAKVAEIVSQVRSGQLTLEELDSLAEKGAEALTGALAVIFGTGNPTEIALSFLSTKNFDQEIRKRDAIGDLAQLLENTFGVSFPGDERLGEVRAKLERQILFTDFIRALGDAIPTRLQTFELASQNVAVEAALGLARAWRNRRDIADSYVDAAHRLQSEVGFTTLNLDMDTLSQTETFATAETLLQEKVEKALRKQATAQLVGLIDTRLDSFWADSNPSIKTRWEVVRHAGRLLLSAHQIRAALKGRTWTAEKLIQEYVYGEEPWCQMDMFYRHLERDFHFFELDPHHHDSLHKLIAHARKEYTAVANQLAEDFTTQYAAREFDIPSVMRQSDIYAQSVKTHDSERVAYVLVDAFRFEMAHELLQQIAEQQEQWLSDLEPALATPPTITTVGMAALMPGAERGVVLKEEKGTLIPVIAGTSLRTRQDRVKHFRASVGGQVVEAKLSDIAPLDNAKLRKATEQAAALLITSTEDIDGLAENNPSLARGMLDQVLSQLRRGIKTLFDLGIMRIVITADHGYLFGEAISFSHTIPNPGGNKVTLKGRVWVGKGGEAHTNVLRTTLSEFGISSDLELATPRNLACFAVPGGNVEYFHGGLSLPELIIPVVTIRPGGKQPATSEPNIEWELQPGSEKVTAQFTTVTIKGRSTELLPVETQLVRVELRVGKRTISVPVAATAGFRDTSKEVELQPDASQPTSYADNTVTLQITEETTAQQATIHLLDATTGVSLAQHDIPVDILGR